MSFPKMRRRSHRNVVFVILISFILLSLVIYAPLLRLIVCPLGPFLGFPFGCEDEYKDWNIHYHLGGNGPWIPYTAADTISSILPAFCSVKQAHLLARHAERFPTRNAGARHISLLKKLQAPNLFLKGSMAFIRDWSYFTDIMNPSFENLTTLGPYAGTRQAYNNGAKLKKQYEHLVSPGSRTNFWTCSSPRDVATARHFAAGFFGHNWEENKRAQLHVIPETIDRGANTLTPGDTCLQYRDDKLEGHDHGYIRLADWQKVFSAAISNRLREDADGLEFTPLEIYGMMELCGFEILARGSSPWCDVFSKQEWLQFEYARDLLHYYRAGPGNRYAGAMGSLWLNAALELLVEDEEKTYFSFVHDSDIVAVITALGILDETDTGQQLPVDRIKYNRRWKTSDVIPMGGYLIIEKVACGEGGSSKAQPRHYVRLMINDGLFDINAIMPKSDLPGATSLEHFESYTHQRGKKFGDFGEVCGLAEGVNSRITFFRKS